MRTIFKDKITPVRNLKRAHIYRAMLRRRRDERKTKGARHE